MRQDSDQSEDLAVVPWDPLESLRSLTSLEAGLSCGFMRCKPERWFPGFAAQWIPLAHSLGVDLEILSVTPQLGIPDNLERGYTALVDGEPMAVFMTRDESRALANILLPHSSELAADLILEYFARRFISSLALSWTSPDSSEVKFDAGTDPHGSSYSGAIKLVFSINHTDCVVWLALGKLLVEGLDRLWRRQIYSAAEQQEGVEVSLEIAELAVPPSLLVEYTRAGTVIDLETFFSDALILRVDGKPWLSARLCNVDGNFGFEVGEGPAGSRAIPEGSTRMSFEIGRASLSGSAFAEISQSGAVYRTDIPLSDQVDIVINSKRVKVAELCSYQGRFAVIVK